MPIERYIRVAKSKITLRSNIDINLANRLITIEYLNYLPRSQIKRFVNPDPDTQFERPDFDAKYPIPGTNCPLGEVPSEVSTVVQKRFENTTKLEGRIQ